MNKKAIIIGATGLVGRELIKQLTPLYDSVIVIARRPPQIMNANMRFYQVNDFANLSDTLNNISHQIHIDAKTDAFSCLGTTKKQAGGEEGFKKVDYEYNLDFAHSCQQSGIKNFFLLSAMGADINSRFFYNRVKGELEQSIAEMGFVNSFFFRPSLLLGHHKGRPLESLSQKLFGMISPVVSESLPAHPISAKRVAIAMAMTAHKLYHETMYRGEVYSQDKLQNKKDQQGKRMKPVTIISNKKMLMMTKAEHS